MSNFAHKACRISSIKLTSRTFKLTACVLSYYLIALSQASSQDVDEIRREQEQIISREEIYQQNIQEELRNHSPGETGVVVDEKTDNSESPIKLTLQSIKLEGVTVLYEYEVNDLVSPFMEHEIYVSEINDLIRNITNAYIEKGYISTRVYIPEQDLSSGVLTIRVLEGRIEKLTVLRNRDTNKPRWQNPIPTSNSQLLNIRDLEQGVDQITRLRSYQAEIDIQPGKTEGSSEVKISTKQERPALLDVNFDNYGSQSTGVNQAEVSLTAEDVFGFYDAWSLHAKRDADFDDKDHFNKSLSYNFSIPFGYWSLRYFGSLFEYRSTASGRSQTFQFSGNSISHRIELERVLHRDSKGKTYLSFALSNKNSRNYIGDILLQVGSQKITTFTTSLTHVRRIFGGIFNSTLSYSKGLKLIHALRNSETAPGGAQPQFDKIGLDLSYYRPFKILDQKFTFQTKAYGQYTSQNLFSSERISFGGSQTVRGFQKGSISGDIGLYIRNDLTFEIYNSGHKEFKTFLGKLVGFVGFDYGWIRRDKNEKFEHGVLKSVLTGLRFQEGTAHTELILGKSLKRPSFLSKEGLVLHIKFGLNI